MSEIKCPKFWLSSRSARLNQRNSHSCLKIKKNDSRRSLMLILGVYFWLNVSCMQTEENAIWVSKIGPPVKTKWRRWITDNIFVQIVSKSRRRGGWILLGKITAILGQLIMVLNYSIDFPDPGRLSQTLPYLVYCVPYSCHFSSNHFGFIKGVQNLPPQIIFQKCTATHRETLSASNFRHLWGF